MKVPRPKLFVILLFFIIPSIFGFTGFYRESESPGPQIRGNPDPDVGIVVKFNSTPEMILADSSDNIRFGVIQGPRDMILSLSTNHSDRISKKFTLIDEKLGFTAIGPTRVSVSFNSDTGTWLVINIWPFPASDFKTWEVLKCHLDEWEKKIDDAGWQRYKSRGRQFKLPTDEYKSGFEVYEMWEENNFDIALIVQPNKYGNDFNKYNLKVSISNSPLLLKNKS